MTTLTTELETEQLSIVLGSDYVLTFQETPGDCFDPVRLRLRLNRGKLRTSGPDYLSYALLDAVIDNYFPVLEKYGERLQQMEDAIIGRPHPAMVREIHAVKRDLLAVRRAVWPLREAVNSLVRDQSPRFTSETRLYLRDCYDHVMQILEVVETYRDVSTALMETYLSSISNRMNEIMKVLTIISTIFMPLSFVAGVYGMNFTHMPELDWWLGYPLALAIMGLIAFALLYFFWRKGWLGALSPNPEEAAKGHEGGNTSP
jgi:magnesium transporter